MLRYRFPFLLFGFVVFCNAESSNLKLEHKKGNLRTLQSQTHPVSGTDKHLPDVRSVKKYQTNEQKFLRRNKIKKPYQANQAHVQFSQKKGSGSVLGFNRKHPVGFQGNAQVRHPESMTTAELQGKTIRPDKSRSRKMKDSIPTDSQIGVSPSMHDQRKENGNHHCPGTLSKKYKDTTIKHQKQCRDRKRLGNVQNNLKGSRACNGDIPISPSPLNSSDIMASTRNAEQMKYFKSKLHGLKQDFHVTNSQCIGQNCESSSDSVTAIGSPKSGSGLFKIGVSVNNDRDEQPWNVSESDDDVGEGRIQIAEARFSILESDQNVRRSFLAENDPACGEQDKDRVLDELNFRVKNMGKCEQGHFADESRDVNDFLLSPARLCTFGLSEGAEVLKGVEKARQEMICEMDAMERNALEKSDSSVHEPQKEEDPEGWAKWQEAKRLLKNIRKQERQLIGSGSSAQLTDQNLSADLAGIGTDADMLGSALDAEIHVSSQDENMTGIYNMTFKNLAAGLLELVRRRTGLNSSSDAQLHTDNTEDDRSQSRTDPSDLSMLSHDSGMVVEMNEEEGVTRWVDAVDAVQSTPSWKRIGRSKRISRSAQCAEIARDNIAESIKSLFAEESDDHVSNIPIEDASHDGQTKNIKAVCPAATPSWKRLGKRKQAARSMQSAGIVHDEIIDSIQGLFPAPPPSEAQSAANIPINSVSHDGQTEFVPSFSTPTWKRIGRIKRICRADKRADNSKHEIVGLTQNFALASPRHVSVPSPFDGSQLIIDDSIPSPLPASRSACKARPFSRSVELSALSTISKQSPVASLVDPQMLPTTSNTCTTLGTSAPIAIAQDAFISDKQGIKTSCPDEAEDHSDEIVKTPVQVRRVMNRIDDLLARRRVCSASSIPSDFIGQAIVPKTACILEPEPPDPGKELFRSQSQLRSTELSPIVLRDTQTRTVLVAKAAAAPRRRSQHGPSARPVPLLRRGQS